MLNHVIGRSNPPCCLSTMHYDVAVGSKQPCCWWIMVLFPLLHPLVTCHGRHCCGCGLPRQPTAQVILDAMLPLTHKPHAPSLDNLARPPLTWILTPSAACGIVTLNTVSPLTWMPPALMPAASVKLLSTARGSCLTTLLADQTHNGAFASSVMVSSTVAPDCPPDTHLQ